MGYANSPMGLDDLLRYFFDDDVFVAMKGARITQPAMMKMAAIECFLRPDLYERPQIESLKLEMLYLEDNGMLYFARPA